MTLLEEAQRDVDAASQKLQDARARLSAIRSVSIGRLSLLFTVPTRLDPLRIRTADLTAYDMVQVEQRPMVVGDGLRVEQVIVINAMISITADSRWYSFDFFQRAIAKHLENSQRR